MSEYDMRGRVVKALRCLDAISVENTVWPGTPDLNFVEGWIELKWLRTWPSRVDSPVTIEHYTQQQRIFLKQRWLRGGKAFLLIQVRLEWLLFTGEQAWDVGRVTREGLYHRALRTWDEGLGDQELIDVLKLRREDYDDHKYHGPGTPATMAPTTRLESGARSKTLSGKNPKILPLGKRPGRQAPGDNIVKA